MSERSFGLDCMRALAALAVVLAHALFIIAPHHANAITPGVILATLGVEAFFVLSGFLIGGGLLEVAAGKRPAFAFWARRCRRTLPNYYFFLAINFLLFLTITPERLPSAAYLVFAQSLASPAPSYFFAESWSLAVEEWFYLCAALAAFFCARLSTQLSPTISPRFTQQRGVRVMLFLLVGIVVVTPIVRALWTLSHSFSWDDGLRKLTFFRFDALALGVLAAAMHLRWRDAWARYAWRYAVAGIVLLACIVPNIAELVLSQQLLASVTRPSVAYAGSALLPAIGVAFACLLPVVSAQQPTANAKFNAIVTHIASWSYSIYLAHVPLVLILLFIRPQVGALNSPLDVALLLAWFAATLICAKLAYRYVERRFYAPSVA